MILCITADDRVGEIAENSPRNIYCYISEHQTNTAKFGIKLILLKGKDVLMLEKLFFWIFIFDISEELSL